MAEAAVKNSGIGVSRHLAPPFSSGKTANLPPLRTEFLDSEYWDELAKKYLSHHTLPDWQTPATPESLGLWLERMDLPLRAFLKVGAWRNLDEVIALAPTWPLRALIGLALETRDELKGAA